MVPKIVIVHCAATPDFGPQDPKFDEFGAHDINLWHLERGFLKIGYHWVIRRTGAIEKGRHENQIGAHCLGHNDGSIGICYVGTKIITDQQIKSLNELYRGIKDRYGIVLQDWYPHNHFNQEKICPGFDLNQLRSLVAENEV